ncbi:MAG: D-sedoheptulose 7-phosphate isomerase [Candidatus Liptonbacteria bacterium]|nr:D-sedoheptulose 7-phosphate isomerase [Candidatus Liptonbacteria bacterium]
MTDFHQVFSKNLAEHQKTLDGLPVLEAKIGTVGELLVKTARERRHLLLCGNGGSAADAQHWSGEWRCRFEHDRPALKATALTVDTSTLTAIGNDYGYDEIFARQVRALAEPGDVLVCISTSGNSPNVIRAVAAAKEMGVTTIGLLGRDGGKLASLVDHTIVVPAERTARIQEMHELIMHLLCEYVDERVIAN